jgi:hypothetical protein
MLQTGAIFGTAIDGTAGLDTVFFEAWLIGSRLPVAGLPGLPGGDEAAIDGDVGAGDVGRAVAGQDEH